LKVLANAVNERVDLCIQTLESNEDLYRIFERGFLDGSSNKRVRWEILLHVINHGNQHRSEVVMMLTKLGHSRVDMEIL
jgi:uncharacterized damage-inducible protein DinB